MLGRAGSFSRLVGKELQKSHLVRFLAVAPRVKGMAEAFEGRG